MNKQMLYIGLAILIVIGVITSARMISGEDSWICQAGVWNLHGRPLQAVPVESCDGKKTVFLDVRRNDEWQAGHIKGALHFELSRLQAGEDLNIPKDANLFIYCKSGNRAETARQMLKSAGFANVTNAGGFENLRAQGYPVE